MALLIVSMDRIKSFFIDPSSVFCSSIDRILLGKLLPQWLGPTLAQMLLEQNGSHTAFHKNIPRTYIPSSAVARLLHAAFFSAPRSIYYK